MINDAQNHTQFFKTDGSIDEHQLGSVTVTSTTHWEGSRLVTAYALSSRQQLVFTYTLLPRRNSWCFGSGATSRKFSAAPDPN